MVSVPAPELPTKIAPVVVQADPAPSTVTVPAKVIEPLAPLTVPAFWMIRAPELTVRPFAVAPGDPTTALPLPIVALNPLTGTPLVQFPAVNQSPAIAPFQVLVCACAGDAPA